LSQIYSRIDVDATGVSTKARHTNRLIGISPCWAAAHDVRGGRYGVYCSVAAGSAISPAALAAESQASAQTESYASAGGLKAQRGCHLSHTSVRAWAQSERCIRARRWSSGFGRSLPVCPISSSLKGVRRAVNDVEGLHNTVRRTLIFSDFRKGPPRGSYHPLFGASSCVSAMSSRGRGVVDLKLGAP